MLQGKCALITGSTQGLGLATAKRFAAAGCNVVINGFGDEREIDAMRAQIEKEHGVRTTYCDANLANAIEIERMIGVSLETFGAIDILVNNAVVRYAAPVEQFPVGEWDLGIAVNLSAAFHTIRLALPAMRRRNWGRIINVSSIYGLIGTANRISYVTSKTALHRHDASRGAWRRAIKISLATRYAPERWKRRCIRNDRTDDGRRIRSRVTKRNGDSWRTSSPAGVSSAPKM